MADDVPTNDSGPSSTSQAPTPKPTPENTKPPEKKDETDPNQDLVDNMKEMVETINKVVTDAVMVAATGGASEAMEAKDAADTAKNASDKNDKKASSSSDKEEKKDPNMELVEQLQELVSSINENVTKAFMAFATGGGSEAMEGAKMADTAKSSGSEDSPPFSPGEIASFDAMAADTNSKQSNAAEFEAPAPSMDDIPVEKIATMALKGG